MHQLDDTYYPVNSINSVKIETIDCNFVLRTLYGRFLDVRDSIKSRICMTPKIVLSSHKAEEKRASAVLVKECFGNTLGTNYYEDYDWLFLQNPAGTGQIFIAYDGDKPIGQITFIPCRYRFMNLEFLTGIGEWLCVLPEYRRQGIMSKLISERANYVKVPFFISVPSRDSIRGFLKSNYRPMSMKLLTRPLKLSKCFTHKKIPRKILEPVDWIWKSRKKIVNTESIIQEYRMPKFDYRFDQLFEKMSNRTMIMQVRSSEYLNWRYKEIRSRNYVILVSTKDGRINGYIIFRIASAFGIRVGFIMDFLPNDSKSGKSLIRHALKYFWDGNAAVAASLCFPDRKEYDLLRSEGFFICPKWIRPSPFTLCVRPSNENVSLFDTNMILDSKRWVFTFGDSIF